jgi:hypothetical protein
MAIYELKSESHADKNKIFQKLLKGETQLCFKIMFLGQELLVHPPTPNLEKHPSSAVHYCSFKFAATIHIWR